MNPGGTSSIFTCPACGKQTSTRQSLLGKRVKCGCGTETLVEAPMLAEPEEETIELEEELAPPPVARAVPTMSSIPSYARTAPRRRDVREMSAESDDLGLLRDWILPGAALGLGLFGRVSQVMLASRANDFSAGSAAIVVSIEFIFAMIAAVLAFMACLKIFDLDSEAIGKTLFKLGAITCLTGAVQFFGGWILRGPSSTADMIVGLPCSWIVTAILVGLFFGYHAWDSWRVGAIIYAVRIISLGGIIASVGATRGRAMLLGI